MDQKKLSVWLKAIITGTALCGALIYLLIMPYIGKEIVRAEPSVEGWYLPWLIFIWATSLPCFSALVCGWIISDEIGKDNSFCIKNSKLLKAISFLAASDCVFFFAGNIVFLLIDMSHPSVLICSVFVTFAGIAVSVAAAALSHLVYKAAQLKEENELTI